MLGGVWRAQDVTLRAVSSAVLIIAAVATFFSGPSLARATGPIASESVIGDAASVTMTLPVDGLAIVPVSAREGDWLIVHARSTDPDRPALSLRLLGPDAQDTTAEAVASGTDDGVLSHRAPTGGTYLAVIDGPPGLPYQRSVFVSKPAFQLTGSSNRIVGYRQSVRLAGSLSDELYSYVRFAGPELAFERVRWETSSDGRAWTTLGYSLTDVNGDTSRALPGFSGARYVRLRYLGALYADCGFGEAASDPVRIVPRVAFTRSAPPSVRTGATFRVTGSIRPRHARGDDTIHVEARKSGSSRIIRFHASIRPGATTPTRLMAGVRLPTKGRWSIRLLHPADQYNATTVSRWVTVVAR